MPRADCQYSPCLPGEIRDSQGAAHATQSWLPDAKSGSCSVGQTHDVQPRGTPALCGDGTVARDKPVPQVLTPCPHLPHAQLSRDSLGDTPGAAHGMQVAPGSEVRLTSCLAGLHSPPDQLTLPAVLISLDLSGSCSGSQDHRRPLLWWLPILTPPETQAQPRLALYPWAKAP